MALPFDLVILDMDGTIQDLYAGGEVNAPVRAAINAVQRAGIPVSIGTGRTLDYVHSRADYLGLSCPVVTTQGAVIGDPVSGRVLAVTPLARTTARSVAAWLDETPHIAAFYFSAADGRTHIYQNRLGITQAERDFQDYVFTAPRTLWAGSMLDLFDAPVTATMPPVKFLLDNDRATKIDVQPELQARFGVDLYITRTHPRLVEGTAQGVDKGSGLRKLCELLGIRPERVLAIGDNDNDIPLLQAAGYGVAMGNCTPGLRAVADWVAPSVTEDGVAVALEKLVLARL